MNSITSQTNFENNSDPKKGISIVIPRVFNNISWRHIKKSIIDLRLGFVERIDVIPSLKRNYKIAFVHFAPDKWNMRDPKAVSILKALQSGKNVKIVYDEPWYWIISISRAEKPQAAPRPLIRKQKLLLKRNSTQSLSNNSIDDGESKNKTLTLKVFTDNQKKKEKRKKISSAAEKRLTKKKEGGGKKRKTRRKRKSYKKFIKLKFKSNI